MKLKSLVDTSVIVGEAEVTGLPGMETFHSVEFESPYLRVRVIEILEDVALPFPNKQESQNMLSDVKGLNTLWNSRLLKKV